jgi:hypothetical protein
MNAGAVFDLETRSQDWIIVQADIRPVKSAFGQRHGTFGATAAAVRFGGLSFLPGLDPPDTRYAGVWQVLNLGAMMIRQLLVGAAVACALTFGLSVLTSAQQATDAKQDAKKAGKEAKNAGKETGEAAKDAGKAAGKATRSAVKKTGQVTRDAAKDVGTGTKKAAKTVKRKLAPHRTHATCKDGTVQTGRTKATACAHHGGVQR